MDLKEIRNISKKMLANFVDEIGLDGEFYASTCNCPMAWRRLDVPGKFIAPGSEELERIIQSSKYDEKTKRILNEKGLILINQEYRQKEAIVTAIHETIHSNRNLLLFDAIRDNKNENAYSSNNGKIEQNTTDYNFSYADASQEVLKGNIDSSEKIIKSYEDFTSEELENMEYPDEELEDMECADEELEDKKCAERKRDSKIRQQKKIDEALVEIMAILSYSLYKDKERGKNSDIWDMIKKFHNNCKEEYYELRELDSKIREMDIDTIDAKDRVVMCEILLRHHDFELFNWMIDPINYSQGDIHYDFFEQYCKDDQDLLEKLYNDEWELVLYDDEYSLDLPEVGKITTADIKKVATSQTAIEELVDIYKYIGRAQEREK